MRLVATNAPACEGDINGKLTIVADRETGVPRGYLIKSDNDIVRHAILFQEGCLPAVGVNGVTIESLLAVCLDRLTCFQRDAPACDENKHAIYLIASAISWLQKRTLARNKSEVLGTMTTHNDKQGSESRVRVTDAMVFVGDVGVSRRPLEDTWAAWDGLIRLVKPLNPPLTTAEMELLSAIPMSSGARNGLTEFRQAVANAGPA